MAWRCSLWASVQRSSARWRKIRLPGRNLAIRRGSDRLQRRHCLRSNSASACIASCCSGASRAAIDCSRGAVTGSSGRVQAVDPLLHDMHVAQFAQAAEEALPCFLHVLPGGIRIDGSDAVRHGTTAAKRHTQVVHRIGCEGEAGAIAFFEDALHPESEAGFLFGGLCRHGQRDVQSGWNGPSFGDLFLSPVSGLGHFPLLPGLGPGL